jgi:phage tail P2-like protein
VNDPSTNTVERLLPFNTSELEQTLEQVHAQRLNAIPLPTPTLWHPDTCPEPLLPWLAWALSVENWDREWDVEIKRVVIATSVATHRQKGTLASIRRVLDAIRVRFELEEWFEYDGEPYTFRLTASANEHWEQGLPAADSEVFNRLRAVVDSVKPVRSHYRTFVKIDTESGVGLANAASVYTVLRTDLAPQFITVMHAGLSVATVLRPPNPYLSLHLVPKATDALPRLAPVSLQTHSVASLNTVARYRVNAQLPPWDDELTVTGMGRLKAVSVFRQGWELIRPESALYSTAALALTVVLSIAAVLH